MYMLKGFMTIQALADNAPGQIATLGELSTHAKTYSRELGYYNNSQYPDVDFVSFHSVDTNGLDVVVPSTHSDVLLHLGQWMYENSVNGILIGEPDDFVTKVLNEFSEQISDLTTGRMLENSQGNFLPEYIQFKVRNQDDNYIKIWFSDDSFRRQYDEYEILVVPPVENVDDLFKTPQEVKALLDEMDDSKRMLRIEQTREQNPDTHTRVDMYTWHNPLQMEYELSTPWTVIIYGAAGNTLDRIRRATVEWVLENSAYPEDEWEKFIPDLFKVTEFLITPLWDEYSIPNETLTAGLNSPIIDYNIILEKARATATQYPDVHVDQYTQVSVANYKSLGFIVVGGTENRDGIYTFKAQFPDYIVIPTSSNEFGRMSPITQEWVMKFSEMLKIAETMDTFSDVPLGYTRVIRDNVMYVAMMHDQVQYLVVSQKSYNEIFDVPIET
tara:strand:+ start:12183 stop:13508 length:1326 start_codon:yes stop_codon:yes gene_type:complete